MPDSISERNLNRYFRQPGKFNGQFLHKISISAHTTCVNVHRKMDGKKGRRQLWQQILSRVKP